MRSGVLGIALSILGLAGCGTFSIPRIAAKGTTIVFPVPDAFGAGFGRALNDDLEYWDLDLADNVVPPNNPDLEDFQRGELLFVLRDGPTTSSTRKIYLPVRYITRVHVDEASSAALPAEGESYSFVGTPMQTGQIVAFADVPYETIPGIYYVFVERWRRKTDGSNTFEQMTAKPIGFNGVQLPWWSWGGVDGWGGPASSPDAGFKIRIVEQTYGSAFFHIPRGYDRWDGDYSFLDHEEDLNQLVPNLKLRIWIGEPSTLTFPAAWEITLAYPAGKIEVTGAALGRTHRSGGLVTVSTDASPSACGGSGTSRISMIDPERYSGWVDVVYRLRSSTCGRAVLSDFEVVGEPKAYDVDGNPISLPTVLDAEYSF